MAKGGSAEKTVREIRRKTRRKFSAEEKIRIVLEGLRGEESIASLCRREGIAANLYYRWSKEFLEAGKKRLLGDTQREATSTEVTDLRKENARLKEVVAETLDLARAATGIDQVRVEHKPRLLSDNGPCYLAKDLGAYLEKHAMGHTRGRPYHPMTQGKIERYHRSMKNVVRFENHYSPWELERAVARFVDYYNYERLHEAIGNVTPDDMYHGRQREILGRRAKIKRLTLQRRKKENLRNAA